MIRWIKFCKRVEQCRLSGLQPEDRTFEYALNGKTELLPADRVRMLAVGSRVTIIASHDPATGGVIVKGIVIHPARPRSAQGFVP
jgi:hypothetical protein